AFGESAFFPTRTGIRYRSLAMSAQLTGLENHRDVCLATFAELDLPLTTEFKYDGSAYSLRDLLRDSLANFHLQQEELAWTAIAYTAYLGPKQSWKNRFGEHFTWSDLAESLIKTKVQRTACCGTHLLYAAVLIRRLDELSPALAGSTRAKL